jgi:ADP-dependent NAD(P)H-hydrate dehydratase
MSHPDGSSTPLPRLTPRQPESHKGDFGRALLIGGSQGMAGAIALAGMAALRSGAGLVKLATPSLCQPTVAGFEPSLMTLALPCDRDGRIAAAALPILGEAAAQATVVACGPGLGRGDGSVEVVGWLYRNLTQPLVVDADGLYALAQRPDVLDKAQGPRIFTPHAGEFARLIGREKILPEEREHLARDLARRSRAVVVLKGHRTVVTDGQQLSLNPTGNPGMATGGTGDVLTGIITALLCQRLAPYDAARLGVYVHGLSGDLAADDLGQVSLIASDLIAYLPKAWQKVS